MEFKAYLNQKYQGYESFIENIIYPIFGKERYETAYNIEMLEQNPQLVGLAERTGIRSVIYCGIIELEDNPVYLFDITVKDKVMMERNRVAVQTLVKRVMDTYSGAFMLIHYEQSNKWDWRFTFCQLKDRGEYTDSKRYTFLLGPNQACTTAAQNFIKLAAKGGNIKIGDIVKAFDVEALSDEFFGKYKAHYEAFVEYVTGKRYEGKDEKVIHEPHGCFASLFGGNDKAVRDYVKLLLGRITFLHFLQKKGWLGVPDGGEWGTGDEQFMLNLFEKASRELKDNFVVEVLNPLFFDALDCDRTTKNDVFESIVFGRIRVPYLNGGMFEKADKDAVAVKWPAEYFGRLLRFFSDYNFTIDENDPNEAQVGVDPEMLGKIFENLLEDNKDKGAFYTPKEIVKYMCQEALIAYLKTKTGFDEKLLRDFVHSPEEGKEAFNQDQQEKILDAILSVKICDPAIGSGAFPIGLLNELVWCKEAIFGDKKGRADIKREIIRDNIYGVDIEKGAVDIARLRFWLSLIVDEEKPVALPNLDYKIMQGNTLLEKYNGVELSKIAETPVEADLYDNNLYKDLQNELKKYYDSSNHKEKEIIKNTIAGIIKNKLKTYERRGKFADKFIDMTSINVSENKEFFLWHTWFKNVFDEGGFDIVIGNPPYIEHKKLKGIADKLKHFKVYYGTADFSVYFLEQGLNLLKPSGILSYITTNKFFNTEYGKNVRHLLKALQINQLINFEQVEVFEGILVSSVIINVSNIPVKKENVFTYEKFYDLGSNEFKSEFNSKQNSFGRYSQEFIGDDEWSFSSTEDLVIKACVETNATQLSEIEGVNIYRGVTTGYNPAFIVDEVKKNELLSIDINNSLMIKKMLQGRNIRKWYYNESSEYLLQTGYDLDVPTVFPSIYKHLLQFEDKMKARSDQGKNWWNLRACQYYDEFEVDSKIVWGLTADKWAFALDTNKHYCPSNAYILTSKNVPIKYLLGILNSKLMQYYFSFGGVMTAGGAYTLKASSISALPIIVSAAPEELIQVVDSILSAKELDNMTDVSNLERYLNKIVYDIYGLRYNQIKIIESSLMEEQ